MFVSHFKHKLERERERERMQKGLRNEIHSVSYIAAAHWACELRAANVSIKGLVRGVIK